MDEGRPPQRPHPTNARIHAIHTTRTGQEARLFRVLLWACAFTVSLGSACAFFRQLFGANTIDLEKADVRTMGVDIRKAQKTICPRERVQMAVFVDVVLEGEKEVKK